MQSENSNENALAYRIEKVEVELRNLGRELIELREALPVPTTLTVTEIAEKLAVSTTTLYKPWNLPNFGKPDIGGSPRRWIRSKALAWYERPEYERRTEWEAMTDAQKAAYR